MIYPLTLQETLFLIYLHKYLYEMAKEIAFYEYSLDMCLAIRQMCDWEED